MVSNTLAVTMPVPGVLKLPNEVLLAICELVNADRDTGRASHNQIPSFRLVCRRFRDVCSHLLLSHTTVDISRPETLARLHGIAGNPGIARGVDRVDVRLHFYHSSLAASFDNFVVAITSEWHQRQRGVGRTEPRREGELGFTDVITLFLEELERSEAGDGGSDKKVEGSDPNTSASWPNEVLQRAYEVYKNGCAAQDAVLRTGNFAQSLARAFAKLPKASLLELYDGERWNNHPPGARIRVDAEDRKGQEEALVQVLSRPMLWEEARWILPSENTWPVVPVELLVNIPLEIGKLNGVFLSTLSIQVSAAPNYMLLLTEPECLAQLSAAVRNMSLFQVRFKPLCRSGCGPWAVDDDGRPLYVIRSANEMRAINDYLGALLDTETMSDVEINLGEFWYSAGIDSIFDSTASLGADFSWPLGSGLENLSLCMVCLTVAELEKVAKSLCEEPEIDMHSVCLRGGTWKEALDMLRRELQKPWRVNFQCPMGGEIDVLSEAQISFAFNRDDKSNSSACSRAECYIQGEDLSNPLQL